MLKIMVTGANGFIGSALINALLNKRIYEVVATYRQLPKTTPELVSVFETGNLVKSIDWAPALTGTDAIVHLAGHVHILKEGRDEPYGLYQKVNIGTTIELARQAIESGIKRFVFVSSIGVNGSVSRRPLNEEDAPSPETLYAVSKYGAEQELQQLCSGSCMDLVIIRPPLVYGASAPGNFTRLIKLASSPLPLPFARMDNLRSFISVANLVDFLVCSVRHPHAANQLFLISDGEDASVGDLIAGLRRAMGKSERLFTMPPIFWRLAALLPSQAPTIQRLHGDLQINPGKARCLLDWQPPQSLEQGLAAAVCNDKR